MQSLVAAALLLLCMQAGARNPSREQSVTEVSAAREVRAALCDLDSGNYASAQKRVERVLQSDPKNLYAQKVLASTLDSQIKIGDESAVNSAIARKAIEAYQRVASNAEASADDKAQIDKHLLILYRRISPDEQQKEIQRRALDSTRTARDRSILYAVLASQSWECAYRITSRQTRPEKTEIEKAADCAAQGLNYANQAITLDGENESAWSYKANLLREAAKLAELANNQIQQAANQRQADEANKRATDLSAKRRADEDKNWARQEEEQQKNGSFTTKDAERAAKELVEFKAENSLDEVVKRAFIPSQLELTTLVAPIPIPQQKTEPTATTAPPSPQKGCFREVDGAASIQEKRDWKAFSVDEDLVVDVPDNVCAHGSGYLAASEGVMYDIVAIDRPSIAREPMVVDAALNTLARLFVSFRSRGWLDDGLARSFELKLLRKDDINGQPRKVYSYARLSCAERKVSVLVVQASKAHYYTIDITGANESDARVQRFLRSVKLK
jgi:hypothetical protein